MRHSIQADMLELVTDTHREDDGQLTIADALEAPCALCGGRESQHPRHGTTSHTHCFIADQAAE